MGDLGGVEALGNGSPLANKFIVRDGAGGFCFPSEALASFTRRGFRASEPLQPETQHDDSGDDPEAWSSKGRGAEERHRNRVLNRG